MIYLLRLLIIIHFAAHFIKLCKGVLGRLTRFRNYALSIAFGLLVGFFKPYGKLGTQKSRFFCALLGLTQFFGSLRSIALQKCACLLEFFYCRFKACVLNSDAGLCIINNFFAKSQTFGYCKRIGLARNADKQPVGRAERFNVKFAGGILNAIFIRCINLKLCIMRRRGNVRTHFARMLNNGYCKRRALGGVCSGSKLVKQQKRICVALI